MGNSQVKERTYTTKHGTTATMDTTNIGREVSGENRQIEESRKVRRGDPPILSRNIPSPKER